MPSVMDTPELIDYVETHDLTIETLEHFERERPRPRRAQRGFWRMLAHKITQYLTPTAREPQMPSCSLPHQFETPADRLAREYPSLYLRAFCGV